MGHLCCSRYLEKCLICMITFSFLTGLWNGHSLHVPDEETYTQEENATFNVTPLVHLGNQYLSSDPRDCSIFIWYEFTKPKSSRVLKASYWQYLQIVDTISQMSLRVTQGHFWQLQPIPTMENITPSCHILKETDFYSLSASSVCGSQRVHLLSRNSLCTDKPQERITSFLQNKIGINNIEVEVNLNKYFSKFIINYWLSNTYSSGV